ncbi:CHD3-type chromatin-remodeling factor PICKLE-like [Rutidosis leptorrhynchoides]|uniref:CHD3-type chromatin-remodeling factor PICKLE-like n=1 Tax=Rutidosis leptorrhynchoides TaxID=125765 RepID=UPI003A993357
MGLGKTIQSIAFLASLYEENVSPHLVVVLLSTLRNWEREFATWAPHMNVVMYVGTLAARNVIKEYEFYFPKSQKKDKKKKSGGRPWYVSLKAISWETMIVDEGHRLKDKDSKLFSALKQFDSRHRTLLTGTPPQNNLDELFMLMHFLDVGKVSFTATFGYRLFVRLKLLQCMLQIR